MGVGGLMMVIIWPIAFGLFGLVWNLVVWRRERRVQQLFLAGVCVLAPFLSLEVSFSYWGELYTLTLLGVLALVVLGFASVRAWSVTQVRISAIQRLNKRLNAARF